MMIWQWGLLLLGFVWALQSFGVWRQMCHYSDVLKGVRQKYQDGYVGAGICRGRFSKGALVLIVVSSDLAVRRFLVMSGWSVFTKFVRQQNFEGVLLDELRKNPAILGEKNRNVATAVKMAVEQIDKMRIEREEPGPATLNLART